MLGRLTENRAITFQNVWGSGGDILVENNAGVVINDKSAFSIVAFLSAVSLISDTISTLPIAAYERDDNGARRPVLPQPQWVSQPDVDNTCQGHYGAGLVSLLIDGNLFVRKFYSKGNLVNMVVLDPTSVTIKRNGLGRKMFNVVGEDKLLSSDEILHVTDLLEPGAVRGVSRVERLSESLGVASALQAFAARFFSQGATTSGVIEYPGPLTGDQAKALSDGFDARHRGWRKAHKTGILSGGAKYVDTTVPNDSAQFLESRRFAVEEVARMYNIPLSLMGIPGTQSYASVEQNAIQFVTHTLRPYIEKLEWAYSRLLPDNQFIKFNVDGLLRGDFNSRVSAYSSALQTGWLNIDTVRSLEDLPPVPNGEGSQYRVPLANVNLSATDLVAQQEKVNMAKGLIGVGFDPAAVLAALGLPEIAHTGVPTVSLQGVGTINPTAPDTVYNV